MSRQIDLHTYKYSWRVGVRERESSTEKKTTEKQTKHGDRRGSRGLVKQGLIFLNGIADGCFP